MHVNLVIQLTEKEGTTEQLKADDLMAWVQVMNNIKNQNEECIITGLIMAF